MLCLSLYPLCFLPNPKPTRNPKENIGGTDFDIREGQMYESPTGLGWNEGVIDYFFFPFLGELPNTLMHQYTETSSNWGL